MQKLTFLTALALSTPLFAQAAPLSQKEANDICGRKAVRAAHFLAESSRKFKVTFEVAKAAEISTPVTYQFTYPGVSEPLFTVVAYAYPDDRSCLIGSVTNNLAGND